MLTMAEFAQAVDGWENCSSDVERAFEARDYDAYQRAFRQAERNFSVIRKGIAAKLHVEASEELRSDLARIATTWTELSRAMQVWKDELKLRSEKAKKQNLRGKKVKRGYGIQQSQTGKNVQLRAM